MVVLIQPTRFHRSSGTDAHGHPRSPGRNAKLHIDFEFNEKQQAFLDFVVAQYVTEGLEELDQKQLPPLLKLRYNDSMSDAVADLGKPDEIGRVIAGFQKFLYQGGA